MEQATLDALAVWLTHYGAFTLFIIMALGIIAFPVPEETLMVLAGVLMHNGTLVPAPTIAAALFGAMMGITVSYLLGRLFGKYILLRWGSYVGITEEHLDKAHSWFLRFGKWALPIGYFIPGVRHFTGISAGISGLEYPQFALFAYLGALFWVTSFLSIGYFVGGNWFFAIKINEIGADEIFVFVILIVLVAFILSHWKKK